MDRDKKSWWEHLEPFAGLAVLGIVAFSSYQVYDYTQCFTQFNREVIETQRTLRAAVEAEQEANREFVVAVIETNNDAEEAEALQEWLTTLERVSELRESNPYPPYRCSEITYE